MERIETRYYHIKGTPTLDEAGFGMASENYIEACVYYTKGGYSYFSYQNTPRGYFMSVYPIGRGRDTCGIWESHSIGTALCKGCKRMISEVARKSKAKETEAIKVFTADIEDMLRQVYPEYELELEV